MRVLIACEYSGVMRDAFRALGHQAMSCDYLPTEVPGPHHQGDVFDIIGAGWDLMIAHPPCTRLTNAGVRWLKVPPPGFTLEQMWADLHAGAAFYRRLQEVDCIPHKVLENPVMHKHARALIAPVLRRQVVQPHWFGVPEFKATGFELFRVPELVATDKLTPPKAGTPEHKAWSVVHRASPGPDRWKDRSRTRPGVAAACAAQWGDLARLRACA
jgi:hypothetical protein